MLGVFIFFAIFAVVAVIFVIVWANKSAQVDREKVSNALSLEGMSADRQYSVSLNEDVFVDDNVKKIAIRKGERHKIIRYADVIGYELVDDGHTISSGRIGSAIVGGLTFGVVGAVVGAAGSRKNTGISSGVKLKLYLADLDNPTYVLDFCGETKQDSIIYKDAKEKADRLVGVFKYIENQMKQQ